MSYTAAQGYPSRTIRLIVPFVPGGGTDIVARITAEYLGRKSGQTVVVENRSGGAGNAGADFVAKSVPDGYTLAVLTTGNVVINPFLYRNMPFDPLKDLIAAAAVGESPQFVATSAKILPKTLSEFIAYAKAQPGKLSYGSAGAGSTAHLGMDKLARLAGLDLIHVPYRGIGPAVNDLVSGNIQIVSVAAHSIIGFAQAGQIRVLAAASKQRMQYFPDIRTAAEAGLPGYEMSTWFGIFAPKGTPSDIVDKINVWIRDMYNDPETKKRLDGNFLTPMRLSPDQFSELTKTEYRQWEEVVRQSGLQSAD
jgi:tripartite-type tricarboxylate transporter receptor subunit TctC